MNDEVVNMIEYAGSEQATATSGVALRVDGGVVRIRGVTARRVGDGGN